MEQTVAVSPELAKLLSEQRQDNVVSFEYQKVAPRIYKIKIPRLGVGEYGFLAPGALAGANVASQGKIYTFQIVE